LPIPCACIAREANSRRGVSNPPSATNSLAGRIEATAAGSDQDDAPWPLEELQRHGNAGRAGAQDGEFAGQLRAVLDLVRVMNHVAEQTRGRSAYHPWGGRTAGS
jgi:hypothetical protein